MPLLCGVGARACPIPARPTPEFDAIDKAGRHRITFDVSNNLLELSGVANPAVPGFLSPEGVSCESKNLVGFVACGALQPAGDFRQRHPRRDQQMDMVRHDYPCVQFIETACRLSRFNAFGNQGGDADIAEPMRSRLVPIKSSVRGHECVTWPRIRFQDRVLFAHRNRSVQAPCQKYRMAFVVDVRELSSVDEHLRMGRRERLPHISGNSQNESHI